MTAHVTVQLAERSYSIDIGSGVLASAHQFIDVKEIMVVSDDRVAPLYLQPLLDQLATHSPQARVLSHVIPAGEASKRLDSVEAIWSTLMTERFSRKCLLVALGGGVIGDMTGFAAACYQRGVDFVQIPTTLLAQVDSSVGGKTAVNHPQGKNMIGAFHQPARVLIDTDTLNTLPPREWSAGLAEVIKYGALGDVEFLQWLERNMDALMRRETAAVTEAIRVSCQMKADIVAEDEREGGARALLNFGHTFGHAIEAHEQYKGLLHGEAVAVGMCLASRLSVAMGWDSEQWSQRLMGLIQAAQLPVAPPSGMTPSDFMHHMGLDKKVESGQWRLVLPRPMGQAVITSDFDPQLLADCLAQACTP